MHQRQERQAQAMLALVSGLMSAAQSIVNKPRVM